jgi:hypothetical protein
MDASYTPEAYDTFRSAAQDAALRGDPVLGPDHLLLALLRGEDTHAARVLARARINPAPLVDRLERYLSWTDHEERAEIRKAHAREADGTPVSELLPRAGQVLNHAAEEAQRHGRSLVGTEHLLFGVLQEGGSLGSWLLRRAGLHPTTLSQDLAVRLPGNAPAKLRVEVSPAVASAVNSVAGLAVLSLVWSVFALVHLMGLLEPDPVAPFWPSFLRTTWAAVLAVSSVGPGMRLERRVWPRMQALLFASTAGAVALLTAAFVGLAPSLVRVSWALISYLPLVGYLTVTMFRSRTQFGVEAREGWRTLWREGGIYLVVTAILELATLAGYVLRG